MIIKNELDSMQTYLSDASNFAGKADLVYIPESIEELKSIVKDCFKKRIPLTISNARTGLTGSAVPLSASLVSLEKLNKILSINELEKIAILEPGVIISDLQDELKKHGFFYPPNPTEQNSSIGGNVATNASGAKTFKYGATRNFIKRLEILLINGDELTLKRGDVLESNGIIELNTKNNNTIKIPIKDINMPKIKHAAGYFIKPGMDAIDLFIGSEGTLGIITQIELELIELPSAVLGGLVFFDKIDKMMNFVDYVRDISLLDKSNGEVGINVRLLEFFDDNSLNLLRTKFNEIPKNSVGAIWFEQEYLKKNEDQILSVWYDLLSKNTLFADLSWFAVDDSGHKKLTDFRHELPLMVFELISQSNSLKIGTDTAVPKKYMKEYYGFMKEILIKSGIEYYIWGHIGNTHFHANLLSKGDEELKKAKILYQIIIDKALEMKGTVSAEHGIGKLKKEYLKQMFGEEIIQYKKQIKLIFDEFNLLNRYNLFD
jgi:D-lactate dehydrogenase (cytochrome)